MANGDKATITGTIDYLRLYKELEGYVLTLSRQLEEARREIEELTLEKQAGADRERMLKAKLAEYDGDGVTGLIAPAMAMGHFKKFHCDAERSNHLPAGQSPDTSVAVPFSVLVVEVDRFEALNDKHGRVFGDHVLRFVGRVIVGKVRGCDVVARYTGKRFIVLLPKCARPDAIKKACEIYTRASQEKFGDGKAETFSVTVTIGLVSYARGVSQEEMLKRAELALHHGKDEGGGDCVAVCGDEKNLSVVHQHKRL